MAVMPQLTLVAPGDARWVDVPVPVLREPGEALVRPLAVATCDLDTAANAGRFPLPLPYALGHEVVAEVVEVGDGVSGVRPGDTVAVAFQISCGTCATCRQGRSADCTTAPPRAMYGLGKLGGDDWGGALTELMRVPYADAMLVPLPPSVSPAAVASMDNLPDAWRSVGPHLATLDDRRVLVVGGYSIGLYAVAIARALGAEVTYVDTEPRRLAIAEKAGATVALPGAAASLPLFPITVSTAATLENLHLAITHTAPGGICTDTGIFTTNVALPLDVMYTRGVTFTTGRVHVRDHLPAVLDLVASGRLDPSIVTGATASWDDAPAAWSSHDSKLVITR